MNIGRYEVIRKLATGGMAEVFLAKVAGPLGFEKTLVVKRILPHLADEPAFVEMFLAEAKLVAQLNHPHIVQIFDFGEADGAYFVAMEYIDGPNLRTLLKHARARELHLRPTLCAKMIAAACEGLAYAHDFYDPVTRRPLNLIHRDISPDNILLSRQGALKVADFGIAKATGHGPMTQEGVLKGKLPYMSPEHLRGKKLDRRADVYALGLVLYELLTCRKPFDVTTEAGLLRAIIEDPFIPAEERRPDLPEHLQQILDRSLAKDREERYPDCLSFQADLERFAASQGETLGSLHIARLITQVEADTTQPFPTPPPSFPTTRDFRSMEDPLTLPRDPTVSNRHHARAPGSLPQSTGVLDEATSFEQKMRSRGRTQVAASILAVLLFVGGGGYLLSHGRGAVPQEPLAFAQPPQPTTAPEAGPDLADAGTAHDEARLEPGPTRPFTPPVLQDAGDAESAETTPLQVPEAGPAPFSPPKAAAPRPKSPLPQPSTGKAVAGTGFVEFRVVPYATVLLDGQELGTTPFDRVEVSAGRHTVRLVNQTFPKTETRIIYVKPGEQLVVKHNFETQ